LTSGCKRVLELAVDEARRMGHHYIGTEHLLLGLVRQEDNTAVRILKEMGTDPPEIRRQTRRVLQESPVQTSSPTPPEVSVPRQTRASGGRDVQYIGAGSMYLMENIVKKMLDMVGEGKLTIEQANEMLATLQPGLKLNTGMQAWLATLVNQKEQQETRRVRVVVTNRDTHEELFTLTMSLLEGLEKLDQLLLATVQDNKLETVGFESDSSPIRIEIRVEKDEPSE
jgi:ATP-dependent Clp protease ATP-binding subunit ClpA